MLGQARGRLMPPVCDIGSFNGQEESPPLLPDKNLHFSGCSSAGRVGWIPKYMSAHRWLSLLLSIAYLPRQLVTNWSRAGKASKCLVSPPNPIQGLWHDVGSYHRVVLIMVSISTGLLGMWGLPARRNPVVTPTPARGVPETVYGALDAVAANPPDAGFDELAPAVQQLLEALGLVGKPAEGAEAVLEELCHAALRNGVQVALAGQGWVVLFWLVLCFGLF